MPPNPRFKPSPPLQSLHKYIFSSSPPPILPILHFRTRPQSTLHSPPPPSSSSSQYLPPRTHTRRHSPWSARIIPPAKWYSSTPAPKMVPPQISALGSLTGEEEETLGGESEGGFRSKGDGKYQQSQSQSHLESHIKQQSQSQSPSPSQSQTQSQEQEQDQDQAQPQQQQEKPKPKQPSPVSDERYHAIADSYIDRLVTQLEELQEFREDLDCEYSVCFFLSFFLLIFLFIHPPLSSCSLPPFNLNQPPPLPPHKS